MKRGIYNRIYNLLCVIVERIIAVNKKLFEQKKRDFADSKCRPAGDLCTHAEKLQHLL
ncbi:MAG: hypothetical protein L6V88_04865 [Anaerotruncus sp.]|nr:MAG: hypothetical protein L6V88_04865 [Anaerotruncus sp.]